jgi:hypothetical protein
LGCVKNNVLFGLFLLVSAIATTLLSAALNAAFFHSAQNTKAPLTGQRKYNLYLFVACAFVLSKGTY